MFPLPICPTRISGRCPGLGFPSCSASAPPAFSNWRHRHRIHRGDVLQRIVADMKAQAPDHIAVTGDLVNISLAGEYVPARTCLNRSGRRQT